MQPIELSDEHIRAAGKKRRVVVNHQVDGLLCAVEAGLSVAQIMEYEFGFTDEPGSHIDAQWWSLDNVFPMASQMLIGADSFAVPSYVSAERVGTFQRWADDGFNIAKRYVSECHQRGIEAFYSYRLSENLKDFGSGMDGKRPLKKEDVKVGELLLATDGTPMKYQPDWVLEGEWKQGLLDFRVPEVRDAKVRLLRELALEYDFDGIEIDFSRGPVLTPIGEQWAHRDAVTAFVRAAREALQACAAARGRPVLLAVRVADSLVDCHFDGLEVEAWAAQHLADIFVLGVRSFELDLQASRGR
jgi:hypothetical protein